MPKATSSRAAAAARRHNPLAEDLMTAGHLRTQSTKKNKHLSQTENDGEDGERYVDAKMTRKILQIGQELAEEDAAERKAAMGATDLKTSSAFDFESRFEDGESLSDDEGKFQEEQWDDEEDVEDVVCGVPSEKVGFDRISQYVQEVDPNDLDMFHKFVPGGDEDPIFNPRGTDTGGRTTNLADLILEKIAEHEAKQSGETGPMIQGGGLPEDAVQIPAKAVEVYEKVGMILSRYKSGPLPKPFKILPTVPNWPTLLSITRPESWTANAVYAGTRIFISSKPAVAQEYISTVLLDRVREEIHETKKLNVHTYNALKKALYKPACFFKGLLFPLVSSGTCTLREAHIVSSVIARVSIPVLHSAAALLRMCDLSAEQSLKSFESTGSVNIFIRVFLEKKYALPYKVIDALVFHFMRFRAADNAEDSMMTDGPSGATIKAYKLPVLWHQSLLVFAQRYRNDITEDQREALLDLLLVRGHKDIGPEVRRELLAGRGRGVVAPDPEKQGALDAGDDTMDVTF
ncbi:snoRNA-binding rRNA-processing protein ENP1 [Aspergillus clavatus NRRL 1]|uniref:rRNA processing protein Bystin, putative n=1 Tax=Aspergillus clavatus (strain ATCC 1007 / CBS 513.65 / DSM 816 / NCTC 3887 / NRRL 1 / QM 1276 / 107) TaxID=344612 RepID=A1CC55_ASPCL|nr:rRNA processing protein Bystin, putative [Aspergillus clavatus NRRL 1]EAW12112.1 rRNA processing protein Bystin, putative [Aspergillus clavatus NRRL 1]